MVGRLFGIAQAHEQPASMAMCAPTHCGVATR